MHSEYEIIACETGEPLPPEIEQQVRLIFQENYYNYHYMDELCLNDRVKIIAYLNQNVIGYATYQIVHNYAILSNLLVHWTYRNRGVGRILEKTRFEHAKRAGLRVYVSCTCDNPFSQKMKTWLGMHPLCVKYGFRESVAYEDHVGSSVIFSDFIPSPESPDSIGLRVDHRLKRITLLMKEPTDEKIIHDPSYEDYYVELLVGPEWRDRLLRDSRYAYGGLDMFKETCTWHNLFQLKNKKYHMGRDANPQMIVSIEEIVERLYGRPVHETG